LNLENILTHNANENSSYRLGVNQFTDQTVEENARLNGLNMGLANLQRA